MIKKKVVAVILILIMLAVIGYVKADINLNTDVDHAKTISINAFENIYRLFLRDSLPKSLDGIYNGSQPETVGNMYLGQMFAMEGPLAAMVINLQEGDFANATNSFNVFSVQYKTTSEMVPEWKQYFDEDLVAKIGNDINDHNVSSAMTDIGNLGEKCDRCHRDNKPQVWVNFYWRDFRTVNVTLPAPIGNKSWPDAMGVVAGAFDGATVNLAEGKQDLANQSFDLFNASYMTSLKNACSNCHTTPRFYFVSDDVAALVNQFGNDIKSGNLTAAQGIQGAIGEQCMKCHILHQGPQLMKEMISTER